MQSPALTPPDPKLLAYKAAHAQRVALARRDVNTFIELVIRDERTGRPVRQSLMHEAFQALADEHDRLVIFAHVESGKTASLSVGRTLWLLGSDPTLRIAIVSNTQQQAVKITRTIANYIESSPELHEVFPHLKPASPWSQTALTVQRPVVAKEPSVQAFGVHGAVLGSRLDVVVVDDALDYESTRTEEQRRITREWVLSTLMGRLVENGRILVVGTAWHPDDLQHYLEAQGWPTYRFPITNDEGQPNWPERWSLERIEAKRQALGPLEAARQLDVMARSDEESRFRQAWLVEAFARGEKATPLTRTPQGEYGLLNIREPYRTIVGVDLGIGLKAHHDPTAIATVLLHPNKDRELLAMETGRWTADTIIERIASAQHRFMASAVVVETNQAQAWMAQWLKKLGPSNVIGHQTGKNKMSLEWRVEQLAAQLARGQWLFPSVNGRPRDSEVSLLARDLLYYSPSRHCPDRVAALAFADYGCERGSMKVEFVYLPWLSRR